MTDAGRRSTQARRSGVFSDQDVADLFHNGPTLQPPAARSLRSTASRFSLNEHFAATRREYEFGFDDAASSFIDLSTTGALPNAGDVAGDEAHLRRDYFELLCVPRQSPTRDQVRKAYFRLFRLLDSEVQPSKTRDTAAVYLADVQDAFETLVEDSRRERYLEELMAAEDEDSDSEGECSDHDRAYTQTLHPRPALAVPTTDLGLRFASPNLVHPPPGNRTARRTLPAVTPLDFCVAHSTWIPLPGLARLLAAGLGRLEHLRDSTPWVRSDESEKGQDESCLDEAGVSNARPIIRTAPVVAITAASYGLGRDIREIPHAILADRYQPLLPETPTRPQLTHLIGNRPSPLLNFRLRQDLFLDEPSRNGHPDAVVELGSEILPDPALNARFARAVRLPGHVAPVVVELMASAPPVPVPSRPPRLGVALHQRVGSGTGFLCTDSGDFFLRRPAGPRAADDATTCSGFPQFSRDHLRGKTSLSSALMSAVLPTHVEPTVELGYTSLGPESLGLLGTTGRPLLAPADRGISGLDLETLHAPHGSWTISAAASPRHLAGYLRYGLELASALPRAVRSRLPFKMSAYHVEVELCTARYLAFRALRRTSSRSSVGFEVGLSPASLHLNLYWSRLAQRVRLPVLLRSGAAVSRRLLFWTVVLPFFGLAALDLARRRRKKTSADPVARRRAEADELTAVLATGTQARQAAERMRAGLVILAAKYGVPGSLYGGITVFSSEYEVADVTIAVAALVANTDGGDTPASLYIPQGLRKSRLVGFWDPAPGHAKVLQVRYMYRGKESVAEVRGREELRLPRDADMSET